MGQIVDEAKARRYLPQSSEEPNISYLNRVNRSTFSRTFREAIHDSANYIYKLSFLNETPLEISRFSEDVDLRGNDIENFFRAADIKALRDERCGILIDFPPLPRDEDGNPIPVTAADELILQRRPYLALIDCRNIVNWKLDDKGKTLLLLTIKEMVEAPGDDDREEIPQYRILRPGSYEVWQETEGDYRLIESSQTSLNYIPFVIYHVNPFELDAFEGMPPLIDLADLNLAHYRKTSDKDELLHKCTIPVFVVNRKEGGGMNVDGGLYVTDESGDYRQVATPNSTSIGPNTVLYDVDAYFVEPSGAALATITEDLQGLELKMEAKKNSFQGGAVGRQITAEEVIRSSQSNDVSIASMAQAKESAIRKIFQYWGAYHDIPPELCGGVVVDLEALRSIQSRANQQFYDMLLKYGVITPDELATSLAENRPLQDVIDIEARINERQNLTQYPEGQFNG